MSFDHREVGTHEAEWVLSGRLDGLPPLDVDSLSGGPGLRVVVLAAHPDDETLGAAGLVRRLAASGAHLTYVVATDGERSHPDSPTTTPAALSRTRREELVAAVHHVAPGAAVHLLGLPDGGLREHRAALGAAVDALSGVVASGGGRLLLLAPWAGDGHRDHRIVGEVAREVAVARAATLVEYPVWFWHWAAPDDSAHPWSSMRRLHLSPEELEARRRSMSEHTSQVAPLSDQPGDEALLGPEMLAHLDRTFEVFVVEDVDDVDDIDVVEGPAATGAGAPGRTEVSPLSAPTPRAPRQVGSTSTSPGSTTPAGTANSPGSATPSGSATSSGTAGLVDSSRSLGEEFFDDFYTGRSDPWGFESRWYEERKRAVTLASLPRARFRAGLEIGCSTGVLTEALSGRCDTVLGVDIAAAPLEVARRRLGDRACLEQLTTPGEWPEGEFDLVVLSEVGYYYGREDLSTMLERAAGSLTADGVMVLCHWRHPVAEYPLGGDEVHAAAVRRVDLVRLVRHVEEDFLLDVLVHPPAVSVARETGLL